MIAWNPVNTRGASSVNLHGQAIRSATSLRYTILLKRSLNEDENTFRVLCAFCSFCRDSTGDLEPGRFKLFTCKQCYRFLFRHKALVSLGRTHYLMALNNTIYRPGTLIAPDIRNGTIRSLVCRSLSADECRRWTLCCRQAGKCCDEQIENRRRLTVTNATRQRGTCPSTWDGFACWKETQSSETSYKRCPSFLSYAHSTGKAFKRCGENGTWFRHPKSGNEFTNYTTCIDAQSQKLGILITVSCNVISILFLVPAVIIFIYYRALLAQHRVRLHLNLFLSFITNGIMIIVWNIVITYNTLDNPNGITVNENSAGCKFLSTLTRYLEGTCFTWMFAEGYYLHQLLSNTFKPQDNLIPYYVFGWGFPLLPVMIYSIIRISLFDETCWILNIGAFEWIHYVPNLAAIVFNLVFLCNILRILLTQLTAHPNEPSNYRRALKATFILVPLFGIQWFLTIYRPAFDAPGYRVIDIAHRVTTGLQGAFVALIFCYFNSEVLSFLKPNWQCSLQRGRHHTSHHVVSLFRRTCPCSRWRRRLDSQKVSMSTQYTIDQSSRTIDNSSLGAPPADGILRRENNNASAAASTKGSPYIPLRQIDPQTDRDGKACSWTEQRDGQNLGQNAKA
ncbi:calcitonin gene-related peptide type 1 receptor-like [Tubulanus polymorphus]|uniref:calcitonin gene-related peptide type 1 receptor-like n=1 Tax=Tubulanus polymorphus TaxID=672921 RepID=UPI003DA67011